MGKGCEWQLAKAVNPGAFDDTMESIGEPLGEPIG